MVFGAVAVCLALWGLITYWVYIVDILIGVIPLLLLAFGTVALLAGVRSLSTGASMAETPKMPGFTGPGAAHKDE
jgi:hypothetical protein